MHPGQQLELAMSASGQGYWDWDVRSGETRFSERWCSMLGYRSDEIEAHASMLGDMVEKSAADAPVQVEPNAARLNPAELTGRRHERFHRQTDGSRNHVRHLAEMAGSAEINLETAIGDAVGAGLPAINRGRSRASPLLRHMNKATSRRRATHPLSV
jgi:PAS domain-containing protein